MAPRQPLSPGCFNTSYTPIILEESPTQNRLLMYDFLCFVSGFSQITGKIDSTRDITRLNRLLNVYPIIQEIWDIIDALTPEMSMKYMELMPKAIELYDRLLTHI